MSLSTTQYGYIVDPMVPFTDDKGKTIKNGFIRVFMAGTSTPVLTYRNYDGATNQEKIELDNSGRVKHNVIGSKGSLYKVVVYNILHSQENPLLTVDKIAVLGASINATGATIVTGLDSVTVQEENFLKATVEGTGVELALDPTEVTSEVSSISDVETAAPNYVVPLLEKTGAGDGSKISLEKLFELTAQNALADKVAPAFVPNSTTTVAGLPYVYEGTLYAAKEAYQGPWDARKFVSVNTKNLFPFSKDTGSIEKYVGTISASDYTLVSRFYKANEPIKINLSVSDISNLVALPASGSAIIIKGYQTPSSDELLYVPNVDIIGFGFYVSASTDVSLEVQDGLFLQTESLYKGVADQFNTGKNYSPLDVVIENGLLFQFYKNHSAGAFNSSEVKETNADEVYAKKGSTGSVEKYVGTISASDYSLVSRYYKANSPVKINLSVSGGGVNLVAQPVTGSAIVIKGYQSAASDSLVYTPTVDIKGFGFYVGASRDVEISITDGLFYDVESLKGYDKDFVNKSYAGSVEKYDGTISTSNYALISRVYKAGETINIAYDTDKPVNLVAQPVSGSAIVIKGINPAAAGSLNYTPTVDIRSFGFYVYESAYPNPQVSLTIQDGIFLLDDYNSRLWNKKLLVLGDSISISSRYFKYLSQKFKEAETVAVSGATWTDRENTTGYDGNPAYDGPGNVMGNQVYKVVSTMSSYNPDVIIMAAGTNDLVSNDTLDESAFIANGSYVEMSEPTFDESDTYAPYRKTMCGAIRWCVTQMQKTFPNAKIFLSTPIQASEYSRLYAKVSKTQNLIDKLATRLDVFLLDTGRHCGIYGDFEYLGSNWTEVEEGSHEGRDLEDGLHPNESGKKKMANYMFKSIDSQYGNFF